MISNSRCLDTMGYKVVLFLPSLSLAHTDKLLLHGRRPRQDAAGGGAHRVGSSFAVSCQVAIRGESRAIRVLLKCIMWLSAPRRRGCWGRCEAGRRTVAAPQHLFKDQMASAHDGEDGNLSICFTPWRSHPTRCKYKMSKYLRTHKYGLLRWDIYSTFSVQKMWSLEWHIRNSLNSSLW